MKIRADIRKGYLARPAIMTLMLLGFGVAFLYDGFVAYPREDAMFTAYRDIVHRHTASDGKYDVSAIDAAWTQAAEDNGWPVVFSGDAPGRPHPGWDIPTQKVLGFICLPLGLVVGFGFVRQIGRWIEVDEQGLTASWGPKMVWSQIVRLDKSKWQGKGIAYLHYGDQTGDKRLKLDDWEYEREPMQAIEAHVERHIDPQRISGDVAANGQASQASSPSASATTSTIEDAPPRDGAV